MSQQVSRIVRDLHDEPHIEGRRITVQFLKKRVEDRGLAPGVVAARHELDLADVYHALAYYHEHPTEMQAVEQERERATEVYERFTTDPDDVRE